MLKTQTNLQVGVPSFTFKSRGKIAANGNE